MTFFVGRDISRKLKMKYKSRFTMVESEQSLFDRAPSS